MKIKSPEKQKRYFLHCIQHCGLARYNLIYRRAEILRLITKLKKYELESKLKEISVEIEKQTACFENAYDNLISLGVSIDEIEDRMYYNYDFHFKK